MTKITIFQNQNHKIAGFSSCGHSGYADSGEDVVCAGISALLITTVNALECYTDEVFHTYSDEKEGLISVSFDEPAGHDGELLVKSMILGLQEIQQTYGNDYIILKFKEV